MYKRIVFGLLVLAVVLIPVIALSSNWLRNPSPETLNQSRQEGYLPYGGEPTGIYLVNSSATFGTFDRFDFDIIDVRFGGHGALLGDPYVRITGTIRNDCEKIQWVALLGSVYDTKGDSIGTIVRTNGRSEFVASYLGLYPNGTDDFSIILKYDPAYDRKDVARYDIYLAWEPTEYPPP